MKLFGIFLILRSVCIIHGDIPETTLENVLNYLSKYNDISVASIIVLSSQFDVVTDKYEGTILETVWKSSFSQNKMVSYLYLYEGINKLQILDRAKSALIMVLDGHSTNYFQNILISLPNSYFVDNSWLLISNSLGDGEQFITTTAHRLESVNKLDVNSQIYILMNDDNNFQLFEVYKKCIEQSHVTDKLLAFTNGKIELLNNKFI